MTDTTSSLDSSPRLKEALDRLGQHIDENNAKQEHQLLGPIRACDSNGEKTNDLSSLHLIYTRMR